MPKSPTVSIVGAGAMGHGLALQCAINDCDVRLLDHREANLEDARRRIRTAIDFLNESGMTDRDPADVLSSIEFTLDAVEGVAEAGIVLESISEDLSAKREVFAELDRVAPSDAVFASNTSSLRVTAIAEAVEDPTRVAGCHWWYPPYLLRPVEIVRGEKTASETIATLDSFVRAVDRDPILVERDVPGFVWNRIQFAVLRECLHIVDEGVASPAAVNRAVRDGYATRTAAIGPLETADIAGLELFETIATDLFPDLAADGSPQAPLNDRTGRGDTGIDAEAGFFEYDENPAAITRRRDERVAAIRQALADDGD